MKVFVKFGLGLVLLILLVISVMVIITTIIWIFHHFHSWRQLFISIMLLLSTLAVMISAYITGNYFNRWFLKKYYGLPNVSEGDFVIDLDYQISRVIDVYQGGDLVKLEYYNKDERESCTRYGYQLEGWHKIDPNNWKYRRKTLKWVEEALEQ